MSCYTMSSVPSLEDRQSTVITQSNDYRTVLTLGSLLLNDRHRYRTYYILCIYTYLQYVLCIYTSLLYTYCVFTHTCNMYCVFIHPCCSLYILCIYIYLQYISSLGVAYISSLTLNLQPYETPHFIDLGPD